MPVARHMPRRRSAAPVQARRYASYLLLAFALLTVLAQPGLPAAAARWHVDSVPASLPIGPAQRVDLTFWLQTPNLYRPYDQAHLHRIAGPLTVTIAYQPAPGATMRQLGVLRVPPWMPLAIAAAAGIAAIVLRRRIFDLAPG